jgi:pyridinium-3,5-bisthiocarboxylic acid mononucleotide nickel chelatase
MKILYYDCFSGISGDMNLGAMIHLGVDRELLINELKKLKVEGWELTAEKDQRHGISGIKATVKQTRHEHAHRHLSDIEKIINESSLDQDVKNLSMKIFMKVAEAEALVHGIDINKVHFHEVGAIDSIIDIVGAAVCFYYIKPDAVYVSVVELGSGFVQCDHGTLPVPAPATAEIIKGIPSKTGAVPFEATTPTGAAILATIGTHFNTVNPIRIEKTAYGIGQKENPSVPNVLRVFLGDSEENVKGHDALLIECNIDDMNPEIFEHLSERLFNAGASDVYITGIIMKKGRPGNILNVICEAGMADRLKEIIFTESTTAGIRTFPFRKDTLARKFELINTPYGKVTVKRSFLGEREVSCKPEYEELKKIALDNNIPLKEIYNNIVSMIVLRKDENN